jgi:hypothetical protein
MVRDARRLRLCKASRGHALILPDRMRRRPEQALPTRGGSGPNARRLGREQPKFAGLAFSALTCLSLYLFQHIYTRFT